MGPYEVETMFDKGAARIKTLDDQPISFIVNGHRLRLYHNPLKRRICSECSRTCITGITEWGGFSPCPTFLKIDRILDIYIYIYSSLHHLRLIKLLICQELKQRNENWEDFLAQHAFGPQHQNVMPPQHQEPPAI